MKLKLILLMFVAAAFMQSCSEEGGESTETEMNEQMNQVADSLEQVDAKLEKQKQEIEEASKEVDELLNDL